MNKFENVDVLASLQQIMQQNTAAFQNDFDIDKKILTQAAKSKNAEDKVYLWFSRPNGTHCLRERDVFLRGTREHNTFRFYHDKILAVIGAVVKPIACGFHLLAGHIGNVKAAARR